MDYFRPNHSLDSDNMSLSSLREGSLTSDLDDLTVVAEFDNFSEYDENVGTYRLSPAYEMVGYSVQQKSNLKKSIIKIGQGLPNDNIALKKPYSDENQKISTKTKQNKVIYKDSSINTNNNNITDNIYGNDNNSNSTLRKIFINNEGYENDDFDGVVESNLPKNRDKYASDNSDYFKRKQQKPEMYNKNQKDYSKKSTNIISTGTSPINFDILDNKSILKDTKFTPNSYFVETSKKNSTSFYVPLEDDSFYENGHPMDRMEIKNTRTILKDKSTMTNLSEESKEVQKKSKKEFRDKASLTSPFTTKATSNVSTSTTFRSFINQQTCTDADITKFNFIHSQSSVDGAIDDDVYKQMDELMRETEDLYSQHETEVEKRKKKEMQYEDLIKDHHKVLIDMKSLENDLDLIKREAESKKRVFELQKNQISQTDRIERCDAATQEDSAQMTEDYNLLQNQVQNLEDKLKQKQIELDSLSSVLHQKQSDVEELMEQNELLNEELEKLDQQNSPIAKEELEKLKTTVSKSELNALENNQELQIVLEDTLKDLKTVQQKLKQTNQQLKKKSEALQESEEKVKHFESQEGSLDKIIGNLKTEITNLNNKISEASKRREEIENQNLLQSDHEEPLLNELTRLIRVNTDLNDIIREKNSSNTADENLIRKYNDLRNVASRLQTAVSPLKAKIALANRKILEKNALLGALLKKNGRLPEDYRNLIEESIKEQPRPLSPLTIDHVDRLEHDLVNHLQDSLHKVKDPTNDYSSRRTRSTNNLLDSLETASRLSYNDLSNLPNPPSTNLKLISLFDKPDSTHFESKIGNLKNDKTLKHRSPNNFHHHRSPVLIDAVSSYNNKPLDSHLLLTKSLKTDVLGTKKPTFEYNSTNSFRKPSSRSQLTDASMPPLSTFNSYNDIPPPRDFQIDRMEGRKRLMFCWEPPTERATNSPVVGYELYMSGKKEASIRGQNKKKYELDLLTSLPLPSTFSLHSLTADGQLSAPSQIILHGLHRNKNEVFGDGSQNLNTGDKLKLKCSEDVKEKKIASSNRPTRMLVAFFDFKASRHEMDIDGVTYKELSFSSGNLIETFGEAMSNGYVLARIKGSSLKGLVPANFLQETT